MKGGGGEVGVADRWFVQESDQSISFGSLGDFVPVDLDSGGAVVVRLYHAVPREPLHHTPPTRPGADLRPSQKRSRPQPIPPAKCPNSSLSCHLQAQHQLNKSIPNPTPSTQLLPLPIYALANMGLCKSQLVEI